MKKDVMSKYRAFVEELFFATLTGPGRVWIQSLPFTRLAARLGAGKHDSGVKIRIGA